jgi:hypothetical protein
MWRLIAADLVGRAPARGAVLRCGGLQHRVGVLFLVAPTLRGRAWGSGVERRCASASATAVALPLRCVHTVLGMLAFAHSSGSCGILVWGNVSRGGE